MMTTILFLISSENTFAQIQIKIATLAPQNSEWAEKFQKGSIEIQERTENRVKLKFYWGDAERIAVNINSLYREFRGEEEREDITLLFTQMSELIDQRG